MNIIKLADFTNEAASKTKGKILKGKLEIELKNGNEIGVDFEGIKKYASPFFNNSFSALGMIYGMDTVKKIHRLNITENGKDVFSSSISNAELLM